MLNNESLEELAEMDKLIIGAYDDSTDNIG